MGGAKNSRDWIAIEKESRFTKQISQGCLVPDLYIFFLGTYSYCILEGYRNLTKNHNFFFFSWESHAESGQFSLSRKLSSFNPSKCQMLLSNLLGAIIRIDYLWLQNKQSPHLSGLKEQKSIYFSCCMCYPGWQWKRGPLKFLRRLPWSRHCHRKRKISGLVMVGSKNVYNWMS